MASKLLEIKIGELQRTCENQQKLIQDQQKKLTESKSKIKKFKKKIVDFDKVQASSKYGVEAEYLKKQTLLEHEIQQYKEQLTKSENELTQFKENEKKERFINERQLQDLRDKRNREIDENERRNAAWMEAQQKNEQVETERRRRENEAYLERNRKNREALENQYDISQGNSINKVHKRKMAKMQEDDD
jgi:hypothetical protein